MRALTNTNIMVDDFDYCKNYPRGTFIHFLTHYHADHYKGISPGWNYGPIFCSEITKSLILANFPNIENITGCELNRKYTILLNPEGTKTVDFTFFDANHIPGSVMILFEGYMGTILHTGDMRFNESMIYNNPILYPVEKRNKSNHNCSIHIDELIFDNTYINPVHKFPDREKAVQMLIDIIERNKGKHVIIAMGILGKERVALQLAHHFQACILIPQRKFNMMQAMGLPTDSMTTVPGSSWIEVIHKRMRIPRLEEEKNKGNKNFIMVSVEFTGFQVEQLIAPDGINYLVPYSQHSNFRELEIFVKSICPAILKKLVLPYLEKPHLKNRSINNIAVYASYVKNLKQNGKSAFARFIKEYTNISTLSPEYKRWMAEEPQKQLMKELSIPIDTNTSLRRVVNRKKKSLEDELKVMTKKSSDVEALKNKYFKSQRQRRRSFAENTLHKRAINTSQNLDVIFMKMGGKKKIKTDFTSINDESQKMRNDSDILDEEKRIHIKITPKLSIQQLFQKKDEEKHRYNPSEDDELLQLMENFINKK